MIREFSWISAIKMSEPVKIKVKIKKAAAAGAAAEQPSNKVVVTVAATAVPVTQKEEPATCGICIENFTAKLRRCIHCPYCSEAICSQCLEKYLLNTIEDPHCVSCRRGWSQSLLQTFCTKTFLTKTYAEYRSNILLNRSKSYLPRYQEQAERVRASQRYLEVNKIYEEELRKTDEIYKKQLAEYKKQLAEYNKQLAEYEQTRADLFRKINNNNRISGEIQSGLRNLEGELMGGHQNQIEDTQQGRKKFIRRCPFDGCNGFLSSAWKCGLCANWTCPDCFTVKGLDKDTEHTCRPEDKATADHIRKRTKPCPNCGELIEKAEGCDQMFCTSCHSPFSWNRGEIIKTGIIHNPHYFEWLERTGGVPGGRHHADIPCGGLPPYRAIFRTLEALLVGVESEKRPALIKRLTNAYRTCGHIIDVERERWLAHTRPNTDNNMNLGVSFLLGNITENEWRAKLKTDEQKRIKSKEVCDILDAFNNAAIDIWRQIEDETDKMNSKNDSSESCLVKIENWLSQLDQLRLFMNQPLWEISRIYNCQVPQITAEFKFILSSVANERKKDRKAAADKAADTEKGTAESKNNDTTAAD